MFSNINKRLRHGHNCHPGNIDEGHRLLQITIPTKNLKT